MIRNKLEHFLLGTAVLILGLVGLTRGWWGEPGKVLFVSLAVIGGFWAYVMGHGWMILPGLVAYPFFWLYERLDPRETAKIRRKAERIGYTATTVEDLKYYGDELGHRFVWWKDREEHTVAQDEGPYNRKGKTHSDVFGVDRYRALITDVSADARAWETLLSKGWLTEIEPQPEGIPKDHRLKSLSELLGNVLRHYPEGIGVPLDAAGWAGIADIIESAPYAGWSDLSRELIREMVECNEGKEFSLSEDGLRIRANGGHSIPINLGSQPVEPPDLLYYPTLSWDLDEIERADGLKAFTREHLCLCPDERMAEQVGEGLGEPLVLRVRSGAMHAAGHEFLTDDNGMWFTARVPRSYIEIPDQVEEADEDGHLD